MTSPKDVWTQTKQTRIVKETFSFRTLVTTTASIVGMLIALGTVGKGWAEAHFVTRDSFYMRLSQIEDDLSQSLQMLAKEVSTNNAILRRELEINRLGPKIDAIKAIPPNERTQWQRQELSEMERRYHRLVRENANP